MTSVIIFGTSEFSRRMRKYIEKFTDDVVAGYTCNSEYIKESSVDGLQVYEAESLDNYFKPSEVKVLMSIGYTDMNLARRKAADFVSEKGFDFYSFIHPTATLGGTKIGKGNIILENVTIAMLSEIGDFNIMFNDVSVTHDVIIGDFNHFSPAAVVSGYVTIGDHCFLGSNSTVKNGIKVAEFTFLGAGAYLSKNSNPYEVIVPSRSIVLEGKSSIDIIKEVIA